MKFFQSIYLLFVSVAFMLTSCSDFGDLNVNPNQSVVAVPELMITNALYEIGNRTAQNGFEYNGPLMQYHGKYDFNYIDQYRIEANSAFWTDSYRALGDLNDIIAAKQTSPATAAVAKVLKAYVGAQLTDLYGPVPFFEAGDETNLTPKYDSQKDIYTAENGILDLLNQSIETLTSDDESVILGDVLYSGNKASWVKFANALKLKYLLRISEVYPEASAQIQTLASSSNLFDNMNENGVLDFTSEPNNWFLSKVRDGDFALYNITTTVLNLLESKNDPRIAFFYTKNKNGMYVGIPPGSSDREGEFTGLSVHMRASNKMNMVYATYFQQEFDLAEAALKGFISSDAKTHYDNAVKAAFAFRGVEMPADYLTNETKGKWDNTLETLITQKYLANAMIGFESWFDYRRTGFPNLTPAIGNVNNNKIPVRFKYPTEESFTNKVNNATAVASLGANNYDAKSWWDKK